MSLLATLAAWAVAGGAGLLLVSARGRERRLLGERTALRARAVADDVQLARARAEVAVLTRECQDLRARLARFEDHNRGPRGRFVRKADGKGGRP